MLDTAFADAARPARRVILNLLMADYSLGHELLLLQQRNPLVMMNGAEFNALPIVAQIQSVTRAALICCRSWSENKGSHRWLGFWRWKNRRADYPLAIAEFRNYRESGSTFPNILPPEESGRALGAPYFARLTAYACARFGASAMDQPLGLVQWCYFASSEEEGAVRIPNAAETETIDEVARLSAEIEAEHAAKMKGITCPA